MHNLSDDILDIIAYHCCVSGAYPCISHEWNSRLDRINPAYAQLRAVTRTHYQYIRGVFLGSSPFTRVCYADAYTAWFRLATNNRHRGSIREYGAFLNTVADRVCNAVISELPVNVSTERVRRASHNANLYCVRIVERSTSSSSTYPSWRSP